MDGLLVYLNSDRQLPGNTTLGRVGGQSDAASSMSSNDTGDDMASSGDESLSWRPWHEGSVGYQQPKREPKTGRYGKIQAINKSVDGMIIHAKNLETILDELLVNGPDEGGHLSFARKQFSKISKACSVIQWGLDEEARSI
jgi:hypothetical protein